LDNHHSPVKPEDYIRFRLLPAIQFYRNRIPKYARVYTFARLSMICGALAGSVLAFYDYSAWVSVLSSLTAAVIAWTEFSGTEKKLDRYSSIIQSLKSIHLWWECLPEVEELATKNINRLVDSVEKQMRTERSGWLAMDSGKKKLKDAVNVSAGNTTSASTTDAASKLK
jgi:hypothetical protein